MAEKLLIKVVNNGKFYAQFYYRWGGYALDALYSTKEILDLVSNNKAFIDDLRLNPETNIGAISGDEILYNFKECPDDFSVDRGCFFDYEDYVEVDLATGKISFDSFIEYDLDEYEEEFEDSYEDLPELPDNICNFNISELDSVIAYIKANINTYYLNRGVVVTFK